MDEKTTTLFEDYISGNLSEVEVTDLEQRLDTDSELAASFLTFTHLSAHLDNEYSQEREQFKNTTSNVDSSFRMDTAALRKVPKIRRLTFIKYAIAASVVLFFGVLYALQWNTVSYDDYAFDETISLVERGGANTAFAKAENAFNTGKYDEAIRNFDIILADGQNAEVSYYKGIALTEINNFKESEAIFKMLENGTSAFKFKAQFYRALSYLKQDKKAAAITAFKQIPKEAVMYAKAQEILKKLE